MKRVDKNIKLISKEKDVCLIVKANAYGIGYQVVEKLIDFGYLFYAVSTMTEALQLREINKDIKIMLLSYFDEDDLPIIRKNNITFTVYDATILTEVKKNDLFHLKFDLGMGRIGFSCADVEKVKKILSSQKILPEGIFTHLPMSYNEEVTVPQINEFEKIVTEFDLEFKYVHLYNSVGSLKYDTKFDNLVRPGLGIWGYIDDDQKDQPFAKNLKPAITLSTKISMFKYYEGKIGYDSSEEVIGNIITVPIGYHDGFNRKFTGYCITGVGRIVGKICTCQTMILTEKHYEKRQEIILFKEEELYDLAKYSGLTIYEIIVCISERINRVYL